MGQPSQPEGSPQGFRTGATLSQAKVLWSPGKEQTPGSFFHSPQPRPGKVFLSQAGAETGDSAEGLFAGKRGRFWSNWVVPLQGSSGNVSVFLAQALTGFRGFSGCPIIGLLKALPAFEANWDVFRCRVPGKSVTSFSSSISQAGRTCP